MEKSGATRVYEALGDTDFNLKSSRSSGASLLARAFCGITFPLAQWLIDTTFEALTAADTAPDSNRIPY
jgi:hypothetical protein